MFFKPQISNDILLLKKSAILNTVATEIKERLLPIDIAPKRILEVSLGLDAVYEAIKKDFKSASYVICQKNEAARAYLIKRHEKKWFSTTSVIEAVNQATPANLIVSSLFINRKNMNTTLAKWREHVNSGAVMMLSAFGIDTLGNLDLNRETNPFLDVHELGDAMVNHGFLNPVLDVDRFDLDYVNIQPMLDELFALDLISKDEYNLFIEKQETLDTKVSFEIIYGHAWVGAQQKKGSDVFVSVDELFKRDK